MNRQPSRRLIEPKQERSRETLRRILAAVRALMRDTPFEDLTIKSIDESARCSVGTFYERFPNKEAVLPHLLEVHYDEVEQRVAELLRDPPHADMAARVSEVVDLFVGIAAEERGLIRTLVLRNYQRPESIPTSIRRRASRIVDQIAGFVLGDCGQVGHPYPERAARLGLLMVMAAIRECVVLAGATQAANLDIGPKTLSRELVAALMAYLTSPLIGESGGTS